MKVIIFLLFTSNLFVEILKHIFLSNISYFPVLLTSPELKQIYKKEKYYSLRHDHVNRYR